MIAMTLRNVSLVLAVACICVSACDQPKQAVVSGGSPEGAAVSTEQLAKAAEEGGGDLKLNLAKKYAKGDGVPLNQEVAAEWFDKAAAGGSLDAIIELAERYENGVGVKADSDKAESYWRKAAEKKNAQGQYKVATKYGFVGRRGAMLWGDAADGINNAKLFLEWLQKSSEQNYLPAKLDLGMVYLLGAKLAFAKDADSGYLIVPDPERGLGLIKSAAEEGYWKAQWAMAVILQVGFASVERDLIASGKYWEKLLATNDAKTQYLIGDLYYESNEKYYKPGSNKYDGRQLSFSGTNEVAFSWYKKAADQGYVLALSKIGDMYSAGQGVFKDSAKAVGYWKQAAEQGEFGAQRALAFAYLQGNGVVRDYAESLVWLTKAANENTDSQFSEVHKVRNAIGVLYENGWGVEKDPVIAYAWYNIASVGKYPKADTNLARVEQSLNNDQLLEAQSLSRQWRPGKVLDRATSGSARKGGASVPSAAADNKSFSRGKMRVLSSGTGFFVDQKGNLLTNHHVVDGCVEVRLPAASGVVATPVVSDSTNDLALLNVASGSQSVAMFPEAEELKQGAEVFVFGYPLDGYLPSSGNMTPGIVSALAGPQNNASWIQITAPVQPGNSGGPLIDKKGRVVGVVVAKADAIKVASVTGDIPQNINFAISPRTVKAFLEGNNVAYSRSKNPLVLNKDAVEIAEIARKMTVKLECWGAK